MADVFISYSRRDIAFARLLHRSLEENGLFIIVMELGRLFPSGHMYVFIHYALAGFWVTFLAPLLFIKLRLMQAE